MINGVLEIVAAVLFAVIALDKGVDMVWIVIAGIYMVCGILNLVVYAIKNHRKQKAAEKAAAEKAVAENVAAQTALQPKAEPVVVAEVEANNG